MGLLASAAAIVNSLALRTLAQTVVAGVHALTIGAVDIPHAAVVDALKLHLFHLIHHLAVVVRSRTIHFRHLLAHMMIAPAAPFLWITRWHISIRCSVRSELTASFPTCNVEASGPKTLLISVQHSIGVWSRTRDDACRYS